MNDTATLMSHIDDDVARKIMLTVALPILKDLRKRDEEYYEERERNYRLPVRERSYDWQSYCRHGSYIGDPYGGDYLCWKCEDGPTLHEEAIAEAWSRVNRWRKALPHITALRQMGVLTVEEAMDKADALLK